MTPQFLNPAPHLGIMWLIRDRQGVIRLLGHGLPLADAEAYGDRLTCPDGHYNMWRAWRRGRPKPPVAELASVIATDEYEEWPRGRIVFDCPTARFVLYADRQLLVPAHVDRIVAHFNLPRAQTDTLSDSHYVSTRSLRPR